MTQPMGLGIEIPREVTDLAWPWEVARDDPMFVHGSLLHVEPGHPVYKWGNVPADGATIPNVCWRDAKDLIGSGDESTLGAKFEKHSAITGSLGKVELSGKGGLHTILSAGATLTSGQGVAIRPNQLLADYLVANPNHSYYLSMIFRGTRFGNVNASIQALSLNAVPSVSEHFVIQTTAGIYPVVLVPTGKQIGSQRTRASWRPTDTPALAPPYAEPAFANIGIAGYTGTPALTGSAARDQMKIFGVGQKAPFPESTGGLHSRLFYWSYLEDLTVSNRTYSQVAALDYARYQKHVLTAAGPSNVDGGRYHNDTYTDPATIP